ncbi:MAG: 50S ribosomal protein L29 [Armatimonadota bacterium]|nr:50S ribosomal protein L29 [Armatimonadota bacterium]MDR7452632.1 50S ribosomal protein L29 [Armatimonadota bacterium]MDR7468183.1 50S ribosomal protein L29 [Armatimonadota bacterium]MDR7495177.1 50S ribosomal protein L29 [Armatimonadota bacterium]MDR7499311.1 50S ribosomal protein L29 [Armatimonadota bacterium]
MDASALRELGVDDLLRKLDEAQKELFNLRMRVAGQQPNTTKIRELRRQVARLKTVLAEKGVRT